MKTGEGRPQSLGGLGGLRFHFPRLNIYPRPEPHVVIEYQVAGCLALAHHQCGIV